MFFPRRRPQPDNAPTIPCRYCCKDIPVYDDRPRPWCPHCGESLAAPSREAAEEPPPPPPPAKAPEVRDLPREEAYHPWAITANREPPPAPAPPEPGPLELPPAEGPDAPPPPEEPLFPLAEGEPPPSEPAPPAPPPEAKPERPVAPTRREECAACGCAYQVPRSAEPGLACPTCGLVRPVEAFRLRFWGHLACGAVGVLALLAAEYTMLSRSPRVAAEFGGPALTAVALMHLVLVLIGLRRDRFEDREVTRRAVAAGEVTVLAPGSAGEVLDPARPAKGHWLAILGTVLAPCLLFAPTAYQQLRGWSACAGVEPEVVGPGDEVTVSFPDHGISAGRGPWQGEAKVEVLNPQAFGRFRELAAKPLPLDRDVEPSVRFRVPMRRELEGATLEARVKLTVHYPELGIRRTEKKTLTKDVSVTLAEAGCGEALSHAWVAGWLAAALTYLLSAGALLALTLARRPGGAPLLPARA